jgi:poly(ADP-ribose) glycohydrolase
LCALTVDREGFIEDAGCRTLQVDFAASHIGGGVLRGGRVQEEIRFCLCPELLVSMLVMDKMEANEAIIITGFERFSYCHGYAGTLKYAGNFDDNSERDEYGNINTSLVAIDAVNFQGNLRQEEQYHEDMLIRELNKAYVGFACRDERGDISMYDDHHASLHQYEYSVGGPYMYHEDDDLIDDKNIDDFSEMFSHNVIEDILDSVKTNNDIKPTLTDVSSPTKDIIVIIQY